LQFHIAYERAGIAVIIDEGITQTASFVVADINGAMVQIDAGVNGLEGAVGGIAFLITAYDIIAHVQGKDLLVMKNILDNDEITEG
jgi:hypothetical protein